MEKRVYVIGGPNGAGKTTFVSNFLPNYAEVKNFINADNIAAGLSPFDPFSMEIKAGKIMMECIYSAIKRGESFGFETTLAGKIWKRILEYLKDNDYIVKLFFLNVASIDICIDRIKNRAKLGGHYIPEDVVIRRYYRARYNFWHKYRLLADKWYLFDNTGNKAIFIASSEEVAHREYLYKFEEECNEEGK